MEENKEVIVSNIDDTSKEELKLSIKNQFKTKKNRTKFITRCGMFSALSFVLLLLRFPLPFFPSFLEVNFSNLAIVIGSLSLGPVGGEIIVVARFILKILFSPSTPPLVGDLVDLLLSSAIMLPASIYYMFNHNKKGGIIAIILSFVSWIIFALLINWLVALPLYAYAFNLDPYTIVSSLVSGATKENYMAIYLFGAVLPFNLLVGVVSSLITLLTYKKVSILLKKMGL